MTCIAGVVHEGSVVIGGDSAGVGGTDITLRRDPKVFTNGELVIGFTWSFRMGQLLHHKLKPPPLADGADLYRYMVTDFVDSVREALKTGGFARAVNERESAGTFLVGVRGRLFKVESDYQVGESLDGYDACGCGEGYALGVLHITSRIPPFQRLALALRAAAHHSSGVSAPFRYVST